MKDILKLLVIDALKFFLAYAILSVIISWLTENLPGSLDPTGMGILAVIILFIGFVVGAFKIGASYSDEISVQEPGSLIGVFKRPVRSIKYGLISLGLNFLLLYGVIVLSDMFFH